MQGKTYSRYTHMLWCMAPSRIQQCNHSARRCCSDFHSQRRLPKSLQRHPGQVGDLLDFLSSMVATQKLAVTTVVVVPTTVIFSFHRDQPGMEYA